MTRKSSAFTGKHMAAVFIGGFGVVIAVNLVMASYAVGSFHGTVVDNSYVASQKYNGWIAKAEASKALGWQAVPHRREDGRVVLETLAVPADAAITALVASNLPVAEYTALQMKKAVVGHGRAAKSQVQEMVRRLLSLPGVPGTDAADGLGMAITHAHAGAAMGRLGEAATLNRRQHAMYKGGRSY